jgi:hypothetical protein
VAGAIVLSKGGQWMLRTYWRGNERGLVHCYEREPGRPGFVSLCGDHRLEKVGGAKRCRPSPLARCARCDNAESERAGSDESLAADDEAAC